MHRRVLRWSLYQPMDATMLDNEEQARKTSHRSSPDIFWEVEHVELMATSPCCWSNASMHSVSPVSSFRSQVCSPQPHPHQLQMAGFQ